MLRRLALRTQISLWMIASAVIALVVFIFGMAIFYEDLATTWVAGLSAQNRMTLERLVANQEVTESSLITLVNAFSLSWAEGYALRELRSALMCAVFAMVFAVIFGVLIARRLSRPIEEITRTAQQVAHGAFDEKLSGAVAQSAELAKLANAFNSMTEALAKAERESTESAAAIAHELRTPLTVLRGRLQGIQDGAFAPTPELAAALVAQTDTLARIVDDLSALSLLKSGRVALDRRWIDLAQTARDVLSGVQADFTNVDMRLEAHLEPVRVYADPYRIRQALNALLRNALQYAADGDHVQVETTVCAQGAVLRVTDNGPGLSPNARARVFDRWWRAEISRSREAGGSGLGLSVVQAIAQAHGGEARAADAQEGGACFSIILPKGRP